MGFDYNTWGGSWGSSWGGSWGRLLTEGGGSSAKKKKRKKGEGWANERALLEESRKKYLESLKPEVGEKTKPKKDKALKKKAENIGGLELLEEAKSIQAELKLKELELELQTITQEQYEAFAKKRKESLEVILMALELDKYVLLSLL